MRVLYANAHDAFTADQKSQISLRYPVENLVEYLGPDLQKKICGKILSLAYVFPKFDLSLS